MEQTADVRFTVESPIWRVVDTWAKRHGYKLIKWTDTTRMYEKGHPLLRGYGRWQVEVTEQGLDVAMTAGVTFRPLSRPGPGRDRFIHQAQTEVNELLEALGQPRLRVLAV